METRKERDKRLRLLEDDIGRALREAEASGEMATAPSYGRPLDFGDGYGETPDALRMPMKVLKDAGVVPPEVELMRELGELRRQLPLAPDEESRRRLAQRVTELEVLVALRLERLRRGEL